MAAIMIGLVLVAGSVYPKVRGWEPLVVLTQSMEPLLHPGDVVVVEPVSGKDVAVGDVVTYRASDASLITHRVVEVRRSTYAGREDTVIVQGDANNVPDDPLVASQVVGRMLYRMPGYGVFMSLPVKIGLLGVVTLLLLVDSVWASRVQAREKKVEASTMPVASSVGPSVASSVPGDGWTESNIPPGDMWTAPTKSDGWTESNTGPGDGWTVSNTTPGDGWTVSNTTPGDRWTESNTGPGDGWTVPAVSNDAWSVPTGAWN
ncbi:signal peptidase I [uncultured Mobiluncus sp.]|uniref:signal peptidase I n=1 Tax=uncultured Mobiluncus sp. TaxID=293425 RepID=UPI00261CF49C|nr:signal peptidase I [uncultured Mobiluncus sp.]